MVQKKSTFVVFSSLFIIMSGFGMGLVRPGITTMISKKTSAGQGETMGVNELF